MNDNLIFILIAIFGVVIVFTLVYFLMNSMNNTKPKGRQNMFKSKGVNLMEISQYLPNFDKERFDNNVFDLFVSIQESCNNYNLSELNKYLGSELIGYYTQTINSMRNQGRILMRNDFVHYYTKTYGIKKFNGKILVNVGLGLEYKEYYVDSSNQVINTGINKPLPMEYNLVLEIHSNDRSILSCPKCGALVVDRVRPTCMYCDSKIISYDYDMIILSQRSKKISKPSFFQ